MFCYELVRRRYAATKYADIANDRKELLLAQMKDGKPVPGNDPFAIIQAKWKEVFGKTQTVSHEEPEPSASRNDPKLGPPRPVSVGAPGSGPFVQGPGGP